MDDKDRITYFARTDFRNKQADFGIKAKDRTRHVYVIGKTGMGKSTLLENMAAQDILNGNGLAFMDPHGATAERLLEYIPEERINDVVYFAPFDTNFPISFNVLEDVGADKRHLVASGLMSSFKKIWVDAWSARMEYILNNILLALLEYPDSTLLGVNRMLSDKDYRKQVVDNIKDPSVRSFWVDEFAKYGDRYMQEAGAAIQNKIGQFTSNPVIRNIVGQPKSSFDIRKMMDEKKILIVNLSKGQIGEQNASLLGGMLITKIYLGAMSRADVSNEAMKRLPNFYFYVDEFQSFASDSFADILSEARKYNLNLTIAHQYVEQMSEAVRAAVFGNVGTMVVFRVGAIDADIFEKEFAPQFTAEDIVNLGMYQIYLRLMIDGVGSKPFSAVTMPPIPIPHRSYHEEIIEASRKNFAQIRGGVEQDILKWHEVIKVEKPKIINTENRPVNSPNLYPNSQNSAKPAHKPFAKTFEQNPPKPAGQQYEKPFAKTFEQPAEKNTPRLVDKPAPRPYQKPNTEQAGTRTELRTEVKSESRDEAKKEYSEPVRPKESLRSMLDKLSIEPEKPKNQIPVSEPAGPKADVNQKENPSENPKQAQATVSLSSLNKSKTPDAQKIADLRALLQKVVPNHDQNQKNAEPKPAPSSNIPLKNNDTLPKNEESQTKEVPEEVLRSILSS